jgi:putative phage-type endonuclease
MNEAQELMYKEIDLIQGSDEWKLYRRTHLMASDTPKICNVSEWGNSLDCYLDKVEGRQTPINEAMMRGTALEPVARDFLNKKTGFNLKPKVFESLIYPFMGASLDAIDESNNYASEIKCPSFKVVTEAMNGNVSKGYIFQCNKQMIVRDLQSVWLFYYFDNAYNHLIEIKRDKDIVRRIIEEEKNFWVNHILPQVPPSKTFKGCKNVNTEESIILAKEWSKFDKIERDAKKIKDEIETKLIDIHGNDNVYFQDANVKYITIERNGNVDWFKLCDKFNIPKEESENFRKPKTIYNKITYVE